MSVRKFFDHRDNITLFFTVGYKAAFFIETDSRIALVEKSTDKQICVVIQLCEQFYVSQDMFPDSHSALVLPDCYEIEFFCEDLPEIRFGGGCMLDENGYGFAIVPHDEHFVVRISYKRAKTIFPGMNEQVQFSDTAAKR